MRAVGQVCFNPKNRDPNHPAPVIFLAKAESERYLAPCQEKPSSSTSTS
jgi:hypothetical protein